MPRIKDEHIDEGGASAPMTQELASLRESIRTCDTQLLQLIAQRMVLARQIGQLKQTKHLPLRDPKIEQEIIERARNQARQLGIAEDLAEKIVSLLMAQSLAEQSNKAGQSNELI